MRWNRTARLWLRSLLLRDRVERELAEELRFHLERDIEAKIATGMAPEEARRAAIREFGVAEQVKEECRDARRLNLVDTFTRDARYAVRTIVRDPGFSFLAIAILALGIGGTTAVFSVVNAVLLRPLPYPDPQELVWLGEILKNNTTDEVTLTPDFLDWRRQNHVFTAMAAFWSPTRTLTGIKEPLQLPTAKVSADFLPVLKAQPILGRNFLRSEDYKGRDQVAILSHGLWQRTFGGRRDVIGQTITLDDHRCTIIGVLPPGFRFPSPEPVDLLTPLGKDEAVESKRGDGMTIVHNVIARLKPGVTLQQARAEMEVIESHLAPPNFPGWAGQITIRVLSLPEKFVGWLRPALLIILCAVGFLLLLACANVASLLLGRAVTRQREMAIRSALGASRGRLTRQLLAESLILAALGCSGGLLLACWTRSILLSFVPPSVPGLDALPLDARVLGFAMISACLCAVIFGLGPAMSSAGIPIARSLGSEGRSLTGGTRRQFWLNLLASAQVAIAVVLLIGGGLMLQSFWRLRYRDLGFRPDHLLTGWMNISSATHPDGPKRVAFLDELLDGIGALPGVESVATGSIPPGEGHATNSFRIEGRPWQPMNRRPVAQQYPVSPAYFRVLGIPLLAGRGILTSDTADAPPIVVISETLARRYFPGENPIGRKLSVGSGVWPVVVGVVGDVKTAGLAAAPEAVLYFSYRQIAVIQPGFIRSGVGILVRTALPPAAIGPALRKRVAQLDPRQPVEEMQTMDELLTASIPKPRLAAVLLGCFAALGLILATTGLYGVISYRVRWRVREIGIRLALGAQPRDVRRMILRQSSRVILLGAAAGLCCAFGLNRLIRSLLYGVSPSDPLTFSLTVGFLALVGLGAAYLPARQAAQSDPMRVLRSE